MTGLAHVASFLLFIVSLLTQLAMILIAMVVMLPFTLIYAFTKEPQ